MAGGVTINFQTNVTERNGHDRTLKEESRQEGGSSAPLLATGNIPADGGWKKTAEALHALVTIAMDVKVEEKRTAIGFFCPAVPRGKIGETWEMAVRLTGGGDLVISNLQGTAGGV